MSPRNMDATARDLAEQLHNHDRRLRGLENKSDLGRSSIEDGSIDEYADGVLQSSTGQQSDGTHGTVVFNGPKPPPPTAPILEGSAGTLSVTWDGFFADGAARPLDLDFVRSRLADNPEMLNATSAGTFVAGSTVVAQTAAGTYWVQLIAESKPGRQSDPSATVEVTVSLPVDVTAIQEEIDAANIRIDGADDTLDQLRGTKPITDALAEAVANGVESKLALAVTQLTAGTGTMAVGVIDKLFSDVVVAGIVAAEEFIGENAILTGAITAPKITASEELTAKVAQFLSVKAGQIDVNELWADTAWLAKANVSVLNLLSNTDGSGYTSQHTPEGLRVFYTDPVTGEQQDRISLGTFPGAPSYFGLTDDNNELSVSLDKDGGIAGRTLDARDRIILKGTDLDERLNIMPQSLVAWGQVPINDSMSSNDEVGLFEIGWETAESEARMYEIELYDFLVQTTAANGIAGIRARFTTDGSAPTINSQIIGHNYATANGQFVTLGFNRIIGSSNGPYIRVLFSLYDTSSGVATVYNGLGQTTLLCAVKDLGRQPRSHTASVSTGGGTPWTATTPKPTYTSPTTPKVERTVTWEDTGVRSYLPNGSVYNYQPSKGYQGLQPYTANGNLRSIWLSPPGILTTVSGATIHDIWAYFYFEHWNSMSGTARIRLHGNTSLPATYNGTGAGINVGNWGRGVGKWIRLPDSTYDGFKTGLYRGLALEGDNTYQSYGIANNSALRIRYTK